MRLGEGGKSPVEMRKSRVAEKCSKSQSTPTLKKKLSSEQDVESDEDDDDEDAEKIEEDDAVEVGDGTEEELR